MIISRADRTTQTRKIPIVYSDIADSFAASPVDGQLGRVTNAASVKQSIRNLIMTNLGERPFQPLVGSDITNSLFELGGSILYTALQNKIQNTITQDEPRANLVNVVVAETAEEDQISVTVTFSMVNITEKQSVTVLLQRVR